MDGKLSSEDYLLGNSPLYRVLYMHTVYTYTLYSVYTIHIYVYIISYIMVRINV